MKGPALHPPRFDTLNAALRTAAAEPASRMAFVDLRERETWLSSADMYDRARHVAGALRHRGLRTGDRVALLLPTSPSFMDAFFGVLLAGATPSALPPPARLGEVADYQASIARMLKVMDARLILTDARTERLLAKAVEHVRPELGRLLVDDLLHEQRDPVDEKVSGTQLALIQFSSGSTTDPKAVALSHAQVIAQCTALMTMMLTRTVEPQFGVSWLPLYHDMGLIGPLLTAVCFERYGLALIRPEHFLIRPALWLRAISRYRAQHSPAPNFGYALCLKRVRDEEMAGVDLSTWRYALNGAEPVSMDVMRRFGAHFSRWGFDPRALTAVYGLSEAALAVTFSPPDRLPCGLAVDAAALASGEVVPGTTELASVGTPVPGMEVEVRDRHGRPAAGRVGRILVRGASVMTGYYNDPAATARALENGWLDTGDLGFEAGGELYVSGRAKDVVIIRGANYTSQTFEACLDAVDGLRPEGSVAVGYVPPGGEGEELLFLAERAPLADPGDDPALIARIREAILAATGVRPYAVQILDPGSLPRTSSGKQRRAEALRRWIAGAWASTPVDIGPGPGRTDDALPAAAPAPLRRPHHPA